MLRLTVSAAFAWLLIGIAGAKINEPHDFEVTHYRIAISPGFAEKRIIVEETITFKSLVDNLETISFSTNTASVNQLDDPGHYHQPMIIGDRRVFRLKDPLAAGQTAELSFIYHVNQPKGFVFGADTIYVNYFTCQVLICDQDRTADKATIDFQLNLTTGMQGVGPGRLMSRKEWAGRLELRWLETRPTSPYLIGFAAGKFQRTRLAGRHPDLIVLSQGVPRARVRSMFRDTRRMLRFFEQKSGVKFDERTYTQVLVDGDEAQEAARHSIIGKEEIEPILKNPREDWVIAHELAHQWWGNSLTCADWSELWLNEGLTVFMVAAYKERRWGRAAYDHELELANKRWQAAKDQGFDVPLSWKGEYPSLKLKRAMAYAKAVVFLDRLRTELGETIFWQAIKTYTQEHKDGTVTAIDLEHALERAAGRSLALEFQEWVFGTH